MAIINIRSTGSWFQRFKGTAATGNGSGADASNPATHLTFVEEIGNTNDAAVTNSASSGSAIALIKGVLSLFQSIVGQANNTAVIDPSASGTVISLLKGILSLSQRKEIIEYSYLGSDPVEVPAGARSYSISNYGVSPSVVDGNLTALDYLPWEVGGITYQEYESGLLWEQSADAEPVGSAILVDPNPLDGRTQSQIMRVSCSAPTGLSLSTPSISLNSNVSTYKTAIESDGASIGFNTLKAINDFVAAISQSGVLAKLDVLWLPSGLILPSVSSSADLSVTVRRCIKGGPLAFGNTNFTNATYTGRGVKGTGQGVLRTGRTLGNYSQATGVSYGFYSRTSGNLGDIWGTRQANNFAIWPKFSNGLTLFEHFSESYNSPTASTGKGFFGLSRAPNSATIFSWLDGAKFQENSLASVTFSSDGIEIPFFGVIDGGSYGYRSTRECSLGFIGQGLTESEMISISSQALILAEKLGW